MRSPTSEEDGATGGMLGRSARKRIPNRRYMDMELPPTSKGSKRMRAIPDNDGVSTLAPATKKISTKNGALSDPVPVTIERLPPGRRCRSSAAVSVAPKVSADNRQSADRIPGNSAASAATSASNSHAQAAIDSGSNGVPVFLEEAPAAVDARGDDMGSQEGDRASMHAGDVLPEAVLGCAELPEPAVPGSSSPGGGVTLPDASTYAPHAVAEPALGVVATPGSITAVQVSEGSTQSAPAVSPQPVSVSSPEPASDFQSTGEATMSESVLLSPDGSAMQVPVDTAILLLTAEDGSPNMHTACAVSSSSSTIVASENTTAMADLPGPHMVISTEGGVGDPTPTSLVAYSIQPSKLSDVTRRMTILTKKQLPSASPGETALKVMEPAVGSLAALKGELPAMQPKDIIVEIVMDSGSVAGTSASPHTVKVSLEDGEDVSNAGQGGQQDYDIRYFHVAGDGKEVFKCTQCEYETDRRPNFYKHKKRHLESRPYKCTECEYSARTSSNLKRHMLSHTNERRFACDRCDLKFRQKIHLEKHIKYIHEEKRVKCSLCEYTCANENPDLKLHMKRKHLTTDPNGPRAVIECGRCGFLAASKRDLKQHFKFHKRGPELKLYCEHCSFVTDCESRLSRHMLTHSQVKPFACSMCDYKATQREHVTRHMKNIHKIDMPVQPDRQKRHRSAAFSESATVSADGQYKVVVSRKYEPPDFTDKQKVFGCLHCTMKFCKLINLYKHLHAQHASLLPPACEDGAHGCVICDFKSHSKKNLLVHMRKHNAAAVAADCDSGADAEVPGHVYACVLCEYMNPTRRNLYQHLKKKHKISLMVKRDGSASCVVEPNAAVTVVASDEGQQVTEVIPMSMVDGSGGGSEKSLEGGRVVNIEELANSLTRPLLATSLPAFDASGAVDDEDDDGSDMGEDDDDDEEDGTAEGDTVMVGTHGLATVADLNAGAASVAPAAEQLVRHQAAEAIVGLAAGASNNSAAVAGHGLTNVVGVSMVGQPAAAGAVRHIHLSSEHLSQLSTGDYIEINGEVYKVEFASPDEEGDGGAPPSSNAVAICGSSLIVQSGQSAPLA